MDTREQRDESATMHRPVMVAEVLAYLAPARGGVYVDCTVGVGGHTRAILEAGATRVIGLDRDADALARAAAALGPFSGRVTLVHADYRDVERVLDENAVPSVDGALADLGVSSLQLNTAERGFSFRADGPLDMRMDTTSGAPVSLMLQDIDETALADVIYQFGEERFSRRIARAIVAAQARSPIATTRQLADIVRRAVPRRGASRIDPATRTFQALRIWVNRELEGLDAFVVAMAGRLNAGARLVVITFHSLEDRIVKHTFRALQQRDGAMFRVVTRRPIVPSDAEVAENPRARSAKLRAIERMVPPVGDMC